jgi:hypothetical protein
MKVKRNIEEELSKCHGNGRQRLAAGSTFRFLP